MFAGSITDINPSIEFLKGLLSRAEETRDEAYHNAHNLDKLVEEIEEEIDILMKDEKETTS